MGLIFQFFVTQVVELLEDEQVKGFLACVAFSFLGFKLIQTTAKDFPRNDLIEFTQSVFALFQFLATLLDSTKSFGHDPELITTVF